VLATLFWNTEGGVIRIIMNKGIEGNARIFSTFFAVWYFFTITTYGTNVPSGLFLPGMIIGCTLGALFTELMVAISFVKEDDPKYNDIRKKYIVIGCSAFMAGYTRMTYSLGVIMMETSQDLSLFVPMIFSIITGNQIGYLFTRSLYQRACRGKQMPIISDKIPGPCHNLRAGDIMAPKAKCLYSVDTVANVAELLNTTEHHAFPIINKKGRLIGIVPRNFIIVILTNLGFYGTSENEAGSFGSGFDINTSKEERTKRKSITALDE